MSKAEYSKIGNTAMRWELQGLLPLPHIRLTLTLLALLVSLALLSACSGKKVKPETELAPETESVEETAVIEVFPSVVRLEDGRTGFVIKEKPSGDEEWIGDFEEAVDLVDQENYTRAIELLEGVIEQSPEVSAPYINIAICYERTGKYEEAEQNLQTALEMIPEHPAASIEYGLLLRETGRFAEAREVYEKALATYPEYFPIRKNLGILCDLYLNDPECAIEQYEKYSEAKPEDEQVKLWSADLKLRLGGSF